MKVVSLNSTTNEVKPQESPPTQAEVTESPPTTQPRRYPDQKRLSEISGAAVYQNPDVSVTYITWFTNRVRERWGIKYKVCDTIRPLIYSIIITYK